MSISLCLCVCISICHQGVGNKRALCDPVHNHMVREWLQLALVALQSAATETNGKRPHWQLTDVANMIHRDTPLPFILNIGQNLE